MPTSENLSPSEHHETIKDLISTCRNEIMSVLSSIVGSSQLLSESIDPLNEKQRELLAIIQRSGKQAVKIVDEVTTLARIETKTLAIIIEPVNLTTCVNEAIDLLNRDERIAQKQRSFKVEISTIPLVLADKWRLIEILVRLLENAYLYTPVGGEITLTAERFNQSVKVSIIDTGIGIDPRYKDALFEKFFRAPDTLVYDHRGLGLSLFLSKYYVEYFGGEVGVESKLGKGSTFWFTLSVTEENR